MTKPITSARYREHVSALEPFQGAKNFRSHNGFAVSADNYRHKPSGTLLYIVLSYGYYPTYIYDHSIRAFYKNDDSFSPTTAKQMGQCHPTGHKVVPMARKAMQNLLAQCEPAL